MSEWVQYRGGTQPAETIDQTVEVRYRDGRHWTGEARYVIWGVQNERIDVIAYRVVEQAAEKIETTSALQVQEGGQHYKDMKIQPVEFIHANGIGYFEGNVIKYVSRWKNKNGVEDLRKARHYIDLLIEMETKK